MRRATWGSPSRPDGWCCCVAVVQADFKASGKKASKDLYQGEEYVTRLTDENWDDKVRALSSGGETLYCTTHPLKLCRNLWLCPSDAWSQSGLDLWQVSAVPSLILLAAVF